MKKAFIITGASSGLGKSLVDCLVPEADAIIISLSRSVHPDHSPLSDEKFIYIKTDLSLPFSENVISTINAHITDKTILYLINNASVITPINRVGELNAKEVESLIRVNILYPTLLINSILKHFNKNKKVFVNISSGAANRPIQNWSLYCSSKAYLSMYFSSISKEAELDNLVTTFNIDPGVLETNMQKKIRDSNFPDKEYFTQLHVNDQLQNPKDAAMIIFKKIVSEK